MEIGTMKDYIKRVYGRQDPLDYIESMERSESDRGIEITLTLRVPGPLERYLSDPVYGKTEQYYRSSQLRAWLDKQMAVIRADIEAGKYKANGGNDTDTIKPVRVIYSGPKTIVFWSDGSKTIVSLGNDQAHDEYTAFCAAIVKKMYGATHKAKKFLDSIKFVQPPKIKMPKSEEDLEEDSEENSDTEDQGCCEPAAECLKEDSGEESGGESSEQPIVARRNTTEPNSEENC